MSGKKQGQLFSGQTNKALIKITKWRKLSNCTETQVEIMDNNIPGTPLLFRCIVCAKHIESGKRFPGKQKHREEWATTAVALTTFTKDKFDEHWMSEMHTTAYASVLGEGKKNAGLSTRIRRHLTYILKLRILHIANGYKDLMLGPEAELGDPVTNFSSPQIIQDILRSLADVIREQDWQDLLDAPYWSFCMDESTDLRNVPEMLLYLKFFCERLGVPVEKYMGSFRLSLPIENPIQVLQDFYLEIMPQGTEALSEKTVA
eukprot:g1297.t1